MSVEEARAVVSAHTPLQRWPQECRCGLPWSQCPQRLEAQAVLDTELVER